MKLASTSGKLSIGLTGLALLTIVFAVYFRSLRYEYVFDDVWRISKNPAVQTVLPVSRYFTDPSTLSGYPDLNFHNYRPLLTLNFAVEQELLGNSPSPHRFINLIIHGLNAGLVAIMGSIFLGLSPWASFVGALLYALHPAQVESTVWISERSGLIMQLFFLLGLIAWRNFLKTTRPAWLAPVFALFATGLFFRENMIVLPAACFLFQRLEMGTSARPSKIMAGAYLGMSLVAGAFLGLRTFILGQFSQTAGWQGGLLGHAGIIFEGVARTAIFILLPYRLSPYHEFLPPEKITFLGLEGLIILGGVICYQVRRKQNQKISFCLGILFFLWLPTSNIVPIATAFADRFAALLLIPLAWLAALEIDRLPRPRARMAGLTAAMAVAGIFLLRTWTYIPVWKNEITLWQQAIKTYPYSNFSWFCLGIAHEDREQWTEANQSYHRALEGKMRVEFAGQAFVHLARTDIALGRVEEARSFAQKGLSMRPDLADAWEAIQKNPTSSDGTLEFIFR